MSEYLVGRIRAAANISLHEGVELAAVHGQHRLESVSLRAFNPDGVSGNGGIPSETLPVSAAFVFIGAEPGMRLASRSHRARWPGLYPHRRGRVEIGALAVKGS